MAVGVATSAASAHADQGDAYQVVLVPPGADNSFDLLRTNSSTGQTALCAQSLTCIPVAEAKPVPAGSYRLIQYSVVDSVGTRKVWGVYRFDARSGRAWGLNFDGKVASWTEYTFP